MSFLTFYFRSEGSPTKMDYSKKGTLIPTSLLADLDGPSRPTATATSAKRAKRALEGGHLGLAAGGGAADAAAVAAPGAQGPAPRGAIRSRLVVRRVDSDRPGSTWMDLFFFSWK